MDLFLYEFEANTPIPEPASLFPTLVVKTCQRTFLLSWTALPITEARRIFQGGSAYEFLLRFASGLESEIKGETDVFGQLKASIRSFQEAHPDADPECLAWFHRLFEDTKEIRAQYLQGIGGNTYGALARRILNPEPESRVLILGAGQITKSVAPYFADSRLSIFNRTEARLRELEQELSAKGYAGIDCFSDDSRLEGAIRSADVLILATPPGSALDARVRAALAERQDPPRILHLGGQDRDLPAFREAGLSVRSLSDLFAFEREQSVFREKQLQQAEEACRRRAVLRSLSRSISIPHGWEDLALFY